MSIHLLLASAAAAILCFSGFEPAALADSPAEQADVEFEQGHYQKACDLYRLALATHRTDVSILLRAAKAYDAAGDLDEAIHRAREAVTFDRENPTTHFALGHYLDANRDTRSAFMQFAQVLDIKKADPAVRKAAYGPILRLGKQVKEWDKTLAFAKQAAHEFSDDADSHYNYAWMLAQIPDRNANEFKKLRAESVTELKRSIELGEKRPQVHLQLASVLTDCNNIADAKIELKEYLRLSPEAKNNDVVVALQKRIEQSAAPKLKQ